MATVDCFLKLDGIDGESKDDKHTNEIDIASWSFEALQTGTAQTGGGQGAAKVTMRDLSFKKKIDKSSPNLFLYCANGKPITNAVLTLRKAGGKQQEYMTITLENALVSRYSPSLPDGGTVEPTDEFTLNYGVIRFEYKEQQPDGTLSGGVKKGWDVKKNVEV